MQQIFCFLLYFYKQFNSNKKKNLAAAKWKPEVALKNSKHSENK